MTVKAVVIKVYATPEEKARIATNAGICSRSVSAYVRTLATGHEPKPRVELSGMAEAFKLHADLGRLGGLMKMLLTNDERLNDMGRDMGMATIDGVLMDIRATMATLKAMVADRVGVGGRAKGSREGDS
ncbi:MAG: conjugal transfer protein TraJ [Planctomycetota bacterium]|jgi:hypothetical protein|nr:conjugal transfer protein TraJ [Planctomycetota bacterium]